MDHPTFTPDPAPFLIVGPPGTAETVEAMLKAFGHDIGYRIAHHDDLNTPPPVEVHEYTEGPVWDRDGVSIRVAPTDHRPVAPTIGFRIDADGASVVLAGDTVPCTSLDELAAGADALVHTMIRKDIVAQIPQQRLQDICDYTLVGRRSRGDRGPRRGRHVGHDALRAGAGARTGRTVAPAGRVAIRRAHRARRRLAPGRSRAATVAMEDRPSASATHDDEHWADVQPGTLSHLLRAGRPAVFFAANIGDSVMLLPTLRALREMFDAPLTLAAPKVAFDLCFREVSPHLVDITGVPETGPPLPPIRSPDCAALAAQSAPSTCSSTP